MTIFHGTTGGRCLEVLLCKKMRRFWQYNFLHISVFITQAKKIFNKRIYILFRNGLMVTWILSALFYFLLIVEKIGYNSYQKLLNSLWNYLYLLIWSSVIDVQKISGIIRFYLIKNYVYAWFCLYLKNFK